MRRTVKKWRAGTGWLCALILVGGCIPLDSDSSSDEQVAGYLPDTTASDSITTPTIGGDGSDQATQPQLFLDGTISSFSDSLAPSSAPQQLYDLGPVEAGTYLWVRLSSDSTQELRVALLDQNQELWAMDESNAANQAQLELVAPAATSSLQLLVATIYTFNQNISYTLQIAGQSGWAIPDPRPQTVLLHYQGGSQVQVGSRVPVDIPPFDAAAIDPRFADATEQIVVNILNLVRADYQGLDVQIVLADDPAIPPGDPTNIYLGAYDARLLGLADNIDPYNQDGSQTAVVFTDTFSLFSVLDPDIDEISQVLANVVSHELGHLLGLRHTANVHDLMDVTATARQMLADQWFTTAPLHESILPVGVQNSPALLSWSVGGLLEIPAIGKIVTRQSGRASSVDDVNDFSVDRGLLAVNTSQNHRPPPQD